VLGCDIEGGYIDNNGVMNTLALRTMASCQPVRYIGFTSFEGPVYITNAKLSLSLAYLIQPGNVGYTNDLLEVNTTYQIQWSQAGDNQTSLVLAPSTGISEQRYRRGYLPIRNRRCQAVVDPNDRPPGAKNCDAPNPVSENYFKAREMRKNFNFFVSNAYQITLGGWGGQACCARWGSKCRSVCPYGVGQPTFTDCDKRLGTSWWVGLADWDSDDTDDYVFYAGISSFDYPVFEGDDLWKDRVWTIASDHDLVEKPCAERKNMARMANPVAQHFWASSAVKVETNQTLNQIMTGMGPFVNYDSVACAQQYYISPQRQSNGGGQRHSDFSDRDSLALNAVPVEKIAFWANQHPVVIRHVAVEQVDGNATVPWRTMRLVTNDATEFLSAAPQVTGELTTTDGRATNPFHLEWLVTVSGGIAVVRSQAADFQVAFTWTPSTITVSTTKAYVNTTTPNGWKDPVWLVDLSNLDSNNQVRHPPPSHTAFSDHHGPVDLFSFLVHHHHHHALPPRITNPPTHQTPTTHRLRSSTTPRVLVPGGWALVTATRPCPRRSIGGALASDAAHPKKNKDGVLYRRDKEWSFRFIKVQLQVFV
jgi:hypothetical protein